MAEFVFSTEQRELRAAVRRFAAATSDERTVRHLMETTVGFDPESWRRLGAELGVLGLAVPEELGGSGGGLVDLAVAVEELGAALACGPVFGTLMLAIPALVAAPDGPVRESVLGPLLEGSRTAALAVGDRAGRFVPSEVTVGATRSEQGWDLTGTVERVVDAAGADDLLVAASGPDGVCLYVVEGRDTERTPLTTLDLTRRQATLRFAETPARLLAGPDELERVVGQALGVGSVLLAAEQVGAAQHLLDLTVGYATQRLQFGRPIGSFQAVKHRLADMLVDLEHARSAAYHGAWALQDGTDDPALAASIAQATCSAAFARIAGDAIQLHGGIGFTWEYQVQLYYKRAITDAALLGSAEEHRARIAALVLAVASPEGAPPVASGVG
ncbi:acyl-CoA dehydrogenase family protein [Pseudonocardia ailaonensis]|uniref:Acyl-CoA dehydrogenase family protein n=1 Tax=Pseudonocardia ailaonensis TaxID=367279 RepID=A0ABN2MQQ1_9PSEU